MAAEDVILRTSVAPQEAWVGQRVLLRIDALGENGWAQIPKLGSIDVPGAYVVRTESQGTRLQETVGGVSYTGQRYELSLYPQKGGAVEIPPFPVDVTIKTWGSNAKETVRRAKTPRTTFTCRVPSGAEGIRGLISTARLTGRQTWEPETDNLDVGDAIKRTITLRAEDVSGMAFAPLRHPEMEGLGIYPGEPTVEDASARGSLTGSRIEKVTYVFERPGEIKIPGVVLPWWDVRTQELRRVELPGRTVRVVGHRDADPAAVTQSEHPQNTLLLWLALTATAIAAVFAIRYRSQLTARWTVWSQARNDREVVYFRRAVRSVWFEDPKAAFREIMRWLDRISTGHRPARFDLFLRQWGDAHAQEAAMDLARSLTSGRKQWDSPALIRALTEARARWREAQRRQRRATALLPELNGRGGSREPPVASGVSR